MRLIYNTNNEENLEIVEGGNALEDNGTIDVWDIQAAQTVGYNLNVALQETSNTGVFEQSIVADLTELVQPLTWKGGVDSLPRTRRWTINPPDGWSVGFPGEKVDDNTYELTPQISAHRSSQYELFAVGNFDVIERNMGTSKMRIVTLPSADPHPSIQEVIDLFADTTPELENVFDYKDRFPQLAILTHSGDPFGSGGVAQENSFITTDDQQLFDPQNSTYVHEQAHTYQAFAWCSGDCQEHLHRYWYSEGVANYVEAYVPYRVGWLDEDEMVSMLQATADSNGAWDGTVSDSPHGRGSVVTAALDMDIRARTNGEHKIDSFLGPIMNQRAPEADSRILIEDSEALTVLYEITGVDYTDFYNRYVHGTEFSKGYYENQFSFDNPSSVDFAAIKYPSIEISEDELFVDEELTFTVEIINVGTRTASRTIAFTLGGQTVATQDLEFGPEQSTSVTFEHTFTDPGTYQLSVDEVTIDTLVVKKQATPTPTPTPTPTKTASPTTPQPTSTGTSPTAEADSPGFGVMTALAGIGSAVGYYLYMNQDKYE